MATEEKQTDTKEQQALADLKARVHEFMVDATKLAMEKIDRLHAAGSGIVEAHAKADGPYRVPRDFMAAFGREITDRYGMVYPDTARAQKRTIDNYYHLM